MIIIFTVLLVYILVILSLYYGFKQLKTFKFQNIKPKVRFSVLVPFKDEAEHLPFLLQSFSRLNYPKDLFEVVLINDNSEDTSVSIVKQFIKSTPCNIRLINSTQNSLSPKKDAIQKAIHDANFEWIVTTDADCTFNVNWLNSYNEFILKNDIDFVASPVTYTITPSFFEAFQLLDFSSLIGVTIGSFGLQQPIMCNGANLAYQKSLFKNVNGFDGNKHMASGDDIFLLEKAVLYNKKRIGYLKLNDATVYTKPVKTLKKLISQRKRWASKTGQSNLIASKLLGLLVLTINGFFVISLLNVFIQFTPLKYSLIFISLKISVDVLLIAKTLSFFKQLETLKYYLPVAFIYPFFNVYIAIISMFGGYKWKNRAYKR